MSIKIRLTNWWSECSKHNGAKEDKRAKIEEYNSENGIPKENVKG